MRFGAGQPLAATALKQKLQFGKRYFCFGYETKTRAVRISAIFQHRHMFSHINGKLSPRRFE